MTEDGLEESTGLLGRIRNWFARNEPQSKREYDYIVNQIPKNFQYVGVIKKSGNQYLRSNLTGELHKPNEIYDLFKDLALLDKLGSAGLRSRRFSICGFEFFESMFVGNFPSAGCSLTPTGAVVMLVQNLF